ncbi:hypothetical protein FJ987_20880 [Mesorhizobium sp. CU2]|uniref:hypothetical protein n=1 Tax=unclassified Mesorhizobium TaxID=325217 RepID=UPI0011277BE3|nr:MULTISPECIES: hypothetical protein [unclassified Mesorhizobium]TPN76077.1 hypothetical protein FJ988_27980 [Mesorhizobium sp. CU3]TPO10468.1 hypothetical protein FJ987_20880 [Mesorhizobium sp. CU2]
MNRIATLAKKGLRLLPRATLILMLLAVPVLAMPMMRADTGHRIEAPAHKNRSVGFVLLVSLQRGQSL